ncbi:hypothetical protein GCM10022629_65760 [Amorphoplanes auranticolor]
MAQGEPVETRVTGGREGDQRPERRRCLAQYGDPPVLQQLQEVRRRAGHFPRYDDQLPAVPQRAPHLEDRDIEGVRVEQGPHVGGVEREVLLRGVDEAQHVAMGDHAALRLPGGSGGVDHVRHRVGVRPHRPGSVRQIGTERGCVQHDRGDVRGDAVGQRLLGDDDVDPGVGGHEGQPVRRVHRVQRHIAGSRRQDTEQGGHQVLAPLDADTDQRSGSDAALVQHARQPLGPFRGLAVGKRPVAGDHGHRVPVVGHPGLERLVEGARHRDLPHPLCADDHGALGGVHDVEAGDGLVRPGRRPADQGEQVAGHPLGRRLVEQGGGVDQLAFKATVGVLVDLQFEVALRHAPGDRIPAQDRAPQVQLVGVTLVHGDCHLVERGARQVALRA